ncbi:fumarylacetoacetate hydrolase family protein [Paenarthrobacter sp. NPDC089989]|uniref:fumarylacetoacetate hydrolase family protein n=1 Tax=unclassified Paenarthrobacter TaxID=2634190 RepID=UPI003809B0F1
MRIARLLTGEGIRHAVYLNEEWHHIDDPFAPVPTFLGPVTSAETATLLAPISPAVVVGIGHNDSDHPLPIQPWLKSVHTVANPEDTIEPPRDAETVNVEGELAVVIGRTAFNLRADNALDHVLGYTIANDVTNTGQALLDERLFQAKSGTHYTPLGPWIETDIVDPESLSIDVTVNGRSEAGSGTFNLPSSVIECLVHVTKWMALEPGDIVLTGAPGTIVEVRPGDTTSITIEGIGTLTNTVA